MKSWGYHNYHEEDEDYLFGLITDLDFCATRFDDLGWQRTGWTRRLCLFKTEGMTDNWSRWNIGDKVGAGIIGENNFKKILEILYSEVEKVLRAHFTVENNYGSNFLNFKDYIVIKKGNIHSQDIQILKITKSYMQDFPFNPIYIKYKIDNNGKITFKTPAFNDVWEKGNYLYEICEALDNYYFCKDDFRNRKDNIYLGGN